MSDETRHAAREGDSARSVVLRHALPDGSVHLDWMIEAGASLATFRLELGTDVARAGRFDAEAIADHRLAYLTYEGAVSGGRGTVTRLSRFRVRGLHRGAEHFHVELEPEDRPGRRILWTGRRLESGRWTFVGAVC